MNTTIALRSPDEIRSELSLVERLVAYYTHMADALRGILKFHETAGVPIPPKFPCKPEITCKQEQAENRAILASVKPELTDILKSRRLGIVRCAMAIIFHQGPQTLEKLFEIMSAAGCGPESIRAKDRLRSMLAKEAKDRKSPRITRDEQTKLWDFTDASQRAWFAGVLGRGVLFDSEETEIAAANSPIASVSRA